MSQSRRSMVVLPLRAILSRLGNALTALALSIVRLAIGLTMVLAASPVGQETSNRSVQLVQILRMVVMNAPDWTSLSFATPSRVLSIVR